MAPTTPQEIDQLQATIGQWSDETFPHQNVGRLYSHLEEEVKELRSALVRLTGDVADGLADVGILLLTIAHQHSISLGDAIAAKHEINRGRTWRYDTERGYDRHVEPVPPLPECPCGVPGCGCDGDDCR